MEVPGGARWDRKKSLEPNLHVSGEDGTQKMVYKLKEEHASGRREQKKKERKHRLKNKNVKKQKNCIEYQSKTIVVPALSLQYT